MRSESTLRTSRGLVRAFTLVELLVVIGIIALLIGILLPALSGARESAKSVSCLSNLRQMSMSAQAYVNENQGLYPVAYWFDFGGGGNATYCWDLSTIYEPGQPVRVIPGLLWRTTDPTQIQQCPSFEGGANWVADPYTGYNYNTSYIGHGQFEAVPRPARVSAVRRPSETVLFGDGEYGDGANKFMRAPFRSPGDATFFGRWSGTQGYRHKRRTNVAFCDGHAEAVAERFTGNADGADNVGKDTGFLSADNSAYDLE